MLLACTPGDTTSTATENIAAGEMTSAEAASNDTGVRNDMEERIVEGGRDEKGNDAQEDQPVGMMIKTSGCKAGMAKKILEVTFTP